MFKATITHYLAPRDMARISRVCRVAQQHCSALLTQRTGDAFEFVDHFSSTKFARRKWKRVAETRKLLLALLVGDGTANRAIDVTHAYKTDNYTILQSMLNVYEVACTVDRPFRMAVLTGHDPVHHFVPTYLYWVLGPSMRQWFIQDQHFVMTWRDGRVRLDVLTPRALWRTQGKIDSSLVVHGTTNQDTALQFSHKITGNVVYCTDARPVQYATAVNQDMVRVEKWWRSRTTLES